MSNQFKPNPYYLIHFVVAATLLFASFWLHPQPVTAASVNQGARSSVDWLRPTDQPGSTDTNQLSTELLQQGTVWQIDQIVGLPKGTLIYHGPGFDFEPAHTCVPEDDWLVLVTGGPTFRDGYVWYDTSRKALDGLPTSGTGWVAPDAPLVECPDNPPNPGDTIRPVISNVSLRQDGFGRAVVRATITDNVSVVSATLWWNGQGYPMQLTGPNQYQVLINQEPNGVLRDYSITAVDPSGNVGVWHSSAAARIRYLRMVGIPRNTGSGGDPVNTAVGNFYTQHQDVYAPAPGLPFDLTRAYNSVAASLDGPFGFGWTHSYNLHLEVVDDLLLHGVVVTYEDGRTANFEEVGGVFVSPPGDNNTLAHEGSGYVLTTPRQLKYHFDDQGRLTSIEDSNNNTTDFSYSGEQLTQITDAAGRAYTLEYASGHISKITDVLGRTYEYNYDGDGNLITYTNPEGGQIHYTYNAEHWLLTMTDPNGHVFVNNTYDDRGRVVAQRDASNSLTTFEYPDETSAVIKDNLQNITRHFYDEHLRLIQDQDANGNSIFYEYDADDNRVSMTDRGGHKTLYSYDDRGNLLSRTDALGQTAYFEYDAQNNLTYQKDESGAETVMEYDSRNNLIHIQDAEGGNTHMSYDGRGLVLTLQDANSHTTHFSYDGQGNLKTILDALNNSTSFTYDAVGRQTSMTDANGHVVAFQHDLNDRVTTITDPMGKTTVFVYDAVGNLLSQTDRNGQTTTYQYNENDSLIQVTDARGNVARYTYDLMYHRLSYQNWRGFVTHYEYDAVYNLSKVIDAKGGVTQFDYDADHNLIRVTDALNQTTQMEYDALHRSTQVADALGGITKYVYDPLGRPTSVLDPKGGTTQYAYDQLGRLVLLTDALTNVTGLTYDPVGNLLSTTNARGFTTNYQYDALNRLVEQTSPLGRTLSMAYDGVGNVTTTTDARGGLTSFGYDANDNLIEIIDALQGHTQHTYDAEGRHLTVTDQNGHTTTSTYDALGNRLSLKLPMGELTTFEYDPNNNLIAVTNAKGKTTQFAYDELDLLASETNPLGFTTAYGYDALQRLILKTDAMGNPTAYGYDALDRLTSVTDALNGVTTYQYDPLGNLTGETDANGHTTLFNVDLLGRVIGETNALGKVWQYQYDPVGNLTQRADANGIVTNYLFDQDNRLTNIAYPSGPNTSFTYDPNNNLIGMLDGSGTSSFTYDALNRLTQTAHSAGLLTGKTLKYAYDPAGNRTRIIYPDGKTVRYTYNANDWLISTSAPTGVTRYTYDPVGLLTHQRNPNGTWTNQTYDDADRLIKLFNGKPAASNILISSFEYTLDPVGNRIRTVEKATRGQTITWTKDYTYDKLYRLLQAVETPSANPYQVLTSAFTYDPVGNRLSMNTNISDRPNTPALPGAVTTDYTYDAANQLVSYTASSNGGPSALTQFTYDDNGNRLSMLGPTRAIHYAYDFENRLLNASTLNVLPNGMNRADATLTFSYDGLNRRIQRGIVERGARKTANYLYDGLGYDLLAQYMRPGSPRATNYYRDPLQVLSRQETQGNGAGLKYFYHYDGLGSVSAWTNQSGRETQEYTYAPYGRLIDNNGPDNASNQTAPHNNLTFSGKLWDTETELYYFGARDYDPTTGTWLQQDPYRGQLTQPMTRHRTMYVNDNPINFVDLYGYITVSALLQPDFGDAPEVMPSAQLRISSNSVASNLRTSIAINNTRSDPTERSLSGGTRTGCGYTMSCLPTTGCGYTMSCLPPTHCSQRFIDCGDAWLSWMASELEFHRTLTTQTNLPVIGWIRNFVYGMLQTAPSFLGGISDLWIRPILPEEGIYLGGTQLSDRSAPANIIFGFYNEILQTPIGVENFVSDADQFVRSIIDPSEPIRYRDYDDDITQRRLGHWIANYIQDHPSERITPDLIEKGASEVGLKYAGME